MSTFEAPIRILPPVHPGEYLREEYLAPLGLSAYELARRLNVPRTRIERLVREETGMTPDTALRLARHLGTTAEFWLNLQTLFDLTRAEAASGAAIARIEPLAPAGGDRRRA
jgi:addiction module HigA family antidote